MNVYDFLTKHIDHEKTAVQSKSEEVTYAELVEKANDVCAMLASLKIQPGANVAILAQNAGFWVASYLGILRYGAVAVPVPIDQHQTTIEHFLQITDCQSCFIDDTHRRKYPHLPVAHLITPDNLRQSTDQPATIETYPCREDDLAALMFTSGSTGTPNAVKVSHKNIITNTKAIVEYLKLRPDDRIMVVLPFYYCFGTSLLHTHLHIGGTLVLNNRFLFTEEVLDDMETYQCTGFAGVPSIYQRLAKRSTFKSRDLPYLRLLQQAGGRLSHSVIKDIVEAMPDKEFYVMYGQTEATARLTYLPPHLVLEKAHSIGIPIPYVDIEILNQQHEPIQPGEEGEIVCSGDSITLGYWEDHPNNRFRNNRLYTGDIATVDEDGYIYIVGRKSDFLKPGGHRFSSHKIVDVLMLHPQVIEAEVVGVFKETVGEIVRAFIGIGHSEVTKQDIKRHCLQHLPRFAIPQEIILTPELPKNMAGKVQKQRLLDYDTNG